METSSRRPGGAAAITVRRHRWLLSASLAACIPMAALFAVGRGGWPGAANACFARDTCFCERAREGLVRQPINTLSCLAFVVAGMWLATSVDRRESGRAARTSFRGGPFAVLVVLVGPCSMALHASLTRWGGKADVMSMFALLSFCAAHAACRAFRWGGRWQPWLFVALAAVLIAKKLLPEGATPLGSDATFGGLVGLFVCLEAAVIHQRRDLRAQRGWLLVVVASFAGGLGLWLGSRSSGSLLCVASSWWQGHAGWHVGCAAACAGLFAYFSSETSGVEAVLR